MFEMFKKYKAPANQIIANKMGTAEFTRNPKSVIKSLNDDLGLDVANKDIWKDFSVAATCVRQSHVFLFFLSFLHALVVATAVRRRNLRPKRLLNAPGA